MFGGRKGWCLSSWITVDDRVRGGISHSYLALEGNHARFYGKLDTTKLGGAGFASQKYVFNPPENMSVYQGLHINLSKFDGKTYAINLYDNRSTSSETGKSVVTYKNTLKATETDIILLFKDFKPYYRGVPVEGEPLDWEAITGFSLMMQSFFNQQSGEFAITIDKIICV